MEFAVRTAFYEELEECARVEREAMGNYCYLEDAWHYFNSLRGGMVCAFAGEEMAGIGRFSVLPDGSGWLETLRVSPKWQRMGAGTAIYGMYRELAEKNGCPSMAMFTGVKNQASAGLARKFGLEKAAQHRGYHLTDLSGGDPHGFVHVNWERAAELILSQKEAYQDYMTMNRTFYRINEENAKAFAIEGKVFEESESGSFIVCGARFQHQNALHIAMMDGDPDRCIDFAVNYAKAQGIPKVSCTFALENGKLEEALKHRGFAPEPSDLITMEVCF